nr:1-acyl-sn-glycerol-3-phosphate acyltransferase [Jannaschia sp. Os4]
MLLLLAFAAVTFASHFLFPSVRWVLRRRAEALVAQLNTRLKRPIEPFKLARRTDTIMRLVHDPEVARAIAAHARERGIPEQVAFETAHRYAREIVPSFSATLYFGVGTRAARWLARSLYRVRVTGEAEAMAHVDPTATVVFVMNHRSNMDYVLVTWLTAKSTALAYAVGEWARRWPLRPLIRSMGGYFVRRRDLNPLYRKVLARYVHHATRGGVTQAVFPEGRLSRTGALGEPKLGILSYVIDAAADPDTPEIVFVPVALNYERVLEDRQLAAAAGQEQARFRLRWWQVARYLLRHVQLRLTGRFRRFGYAAVSYGDPFTLRAFLAAAPADPAAALGAELMARVEAALPVLPVPQVCEALRDGATTVDAVAAHLRSHALEHGDHPRHAAFRESDAIAETALEMLEVRNVIRRTGPHIEQVAPEIVGFYAAMLPAQHVNGKENVAGDTILV